MKSIIISALFLAQHVYGQTYPSWSTEFDFLNYGQVKAIAETSSGDLYLAQNKNESNVFLTPTVLFYNKLTKQFRNEDGIGLTLAEFTDMKLVGDSVIYLSGLVYSTGPVYHRIYKKNVASTSWQQVCQTDKGISCMEIYGSKLFIGGWFTNLNGNNYQSIATYDLNSYQFDSVPAKLYGFSNPPSVSFIKNNGTDLIIAGDFFKAGMDTLNSVARYNSSGWHSLNKGLQNSQANYFTPATIFALAVDPLNPQDFAIGGNYNYYNKSLHSIPNFADIVVKWDHTQNKWDTIPHLRSAITQQAITGPSNLCGLKYYNNSLYISYIYPIAASGKRIIRVNNSGWSLLPISFKDERVGGCILNEYQGDMIISSFNTFPMVGPLRYNFNGSYKSFGKGMSSSFQDPYIFARDNNDIYISNGGDITSLNRYRLSGGNISSVDMMKLNLPTMTYDSIRSRFQGKVYSLFVKGDSIIALGNMTKNNFTSVPNVQLNFGAVYRKTTKLWSPLISPTYTLDTYNSSYYKTMVLYGNGFFIGGKFKINENINLQNLVYWNGSAIDSIKSMPHNAIINTLAVTHDTLWVGGAFTLSNGVKNFAAYKISTKQWVNSGSVSNFGGGSSTEVKKISVHKNKIFIAGYHIYSFIPFGSSPVLLGDTSGSVGYFNRDSINHFYPFNDFLQSSYPNFEELSIQNDSIIYLLGRGLFISRGCKYGTANCDSSGGIVKYNYKMNTSSGYFEGGVKSYSGAPNVVFTTDYLNQQLLFGAFVKVGHQTNSSFIAALNLSPGNTTNINESSYNFETNEIIVYPNPTNGVFTIKSENQIKQVEIYDFTGKLISKNYTAIIDIRNNSSGIYILKTTDTKNNTFHNKIILTSN